MITSSHQTALSNIYYLITNGAIVVYQLVSNNTYLYVMQKPNHPGYLKMVLSPNKETIAYYSETIVLDKLESYLFLTGCYV